MISGLFDPSKVVNDLQGEKGSLLFGSFLKLGCSIKYDPEELTGAINVFEVDNIVLFGPDDDCVAASICACTEFASKLSSCSAFPHSQSQLVQSGYEIIGKPILGNPFTLIAATTAKAVKVAAKAILNAAMAI